MLPVVLTPTLLPLGGRGGEGTPHSSCGGDWKLCPLSPSSHWADLSGRAASGWKEAGECALYAERPGSLLRIRAPGLEEGGQVRLTTSSAGPITCPKLLSMGAW